MLPLDREPAQKAAQRVQGASQTARDHTLPSVALRGEPSSGTREPVSRVTTHTNRQEFRARTYTLRDHVAPHSPERVRNCGRVRVDDVVHVRAGGGRAGFAGIATCRSVWECPVCRWKVCAERAQQIGGVVKRWESEHGPTRSVNEDGEPVFRMMLLSLTLRHNRNDTIKHLGGAVLAAKSEFYRGGAWTRLKRSFGLEYISGWDCTFGDTNGWHPHLHVLVLTKTALTQRQVEELEEKFSAKWLRAVAKEVDGVHGWTEDQAPTQHMPNDHGVDFRACSVSEYVTKLGLEISDPGTKEAQQGAPADPSRDYYYDHATDETHFDRRRYTPLALAWSHYEYTRTGIGRKDGMRLWLEYCEAMRGRRQLTWSRGLSALRAEVVEHLEAAEEAELETVTVLDSHQWDELRDLRVSRMEEVGVVRWRFTGNLARIFPLDHEGVRAALPPTGAYVDARCLLLDVAERSPPEVVDALLGSLLESNARGLVAQNSKMWRQYVALVQSEPAESSAAVVGDGSAAAAPRKPTAEQPWLPGLDPRPRRPVG